MNVFIIPEDYRRDQYILKPIIAAMMSAVGRPRANVEVCQELLGGVTEALKWQRIERIIRSVQYRVNLFLLCVDRDGQEGRRASLDNLQQRAESVLAGRKAFLGENAWQEIEVWVLAGHDLPSDWPWKEIRREVDPKERYFLPYARQRGVDNERDQGRKTLAREAAARYGRIRQLCPEDVEALENRIRSFTGDT